MKLAEIFPNQTEMDIVRFLQNRPKNMPAPDIILSDKDLDITKHDVANTSIYKNREKVVITEDENGKEKEDKVPVEVNRVVIPFQKLIVDKAVSFAFGNEPDLYCDTEDDENKEAVLTAVKAILKSNKSFALNKGAMRSTISYHEASEVWYAVTGDSHNEYGIPTPIKIKSQLMTPKKGDNVFPLFNEYGDMIAFTRRFEYTNPLGETKSFVETYTSSETVRWDMSDGEPKRDAKSAPLAINKIPVCYAYQQNTEWIDVKYSISRLEYLLSKFGDTNDYFASPTLFLTGGLEGNMPDKGESGKVLEGKEGTDAKILSWDNAPAAVKLEIETHFNIIYSFTQTPNISFENVKGISSISGTALKMLFMDAHLKVKDHEEIFIPYLQRRINIIKAYVGVMFPNLKATAEALQIEPKMVPYITQNELENAQVLNLLTGGKAVLSQKTGVALSGWAADPIKEYEELERQESADKTADFSESTI